MRSVAVSSAIRTIGRLPWITATVAPPATRVATTAFEALQPCRNAFANPFANPFANRRLSLASVSRIFMASAGDSVSHATSAANHHPAHVSQADQPTLANPPKSVAGNPSSPTKQGEAATKVPGKRLIGRMEGSDPFALLKALAPMQVLIGAGMLTALILPRPLALALTAAALLPPILRTALHSWRWGGARKGVYREGTSGESRERGEEKGAKGKAQFEREGLLGEVVPEAGEAVGKGKSEGEGWVATAGSDGKQNGVGGRHEAARVGNLLSVNGMDIFKGRMAGKMDGDFCLFLIGARANNPFPLGPSFASVGEVFQQAVRELEQETDKFGYLGGDYYVGMDTTRGSQTLAVMFWRSYDDLVAYANNQNLVHGSAWKRMTQLLRDSPDIGVWHESYAISAGQYEAIYVNCPQFGLGAAGKLVPAVGPLATSKGRMREGGCAKGTEGRGNEPATEGKGEEGGARKVSHSTGTCPMGF